MACSSDCRPIERSNGDGEPRVSGPRVVLDAGCGTGKVARGLVGELDRVDAVDPSAEMLRIGQGLPGGDDPRLRWICAPIEEAELSGPYGLVVAGASFHYDVGKRRTGERPTFERYDVEQPFRTQHPRLQRYDVRTRVEWGSALSRAPSRRT